jgi:Flp pilus assembly pilin Flp
MSTVVRILLSARVLPWALLVPPPPGPTGANAHTRLDRPHAGHRRLTEQGQATAEYALVLLGAAAVALVLVSWAGGGRISRFFDTVFDHLTSLAQ